MFGTCRFSLWFWVATKILWDSRVRVFLCVCIFFFHSRNLLTLIFSVKAGTGFHALVYILEVTMPPSILIWRSFLWKLFWPLQADQEDSPVWDHKWYRIMLESDFTLSNHMSLECVMGDTENVGWVATKGRTIRVDCQSAGLLNLVC